MHDHVLAAQNALDLAGTTQVPNSAMTTADDGVPQSSTGLCAEESICFAVVRELFTAIIHRIKTNVICDDDNIYLMQKEVYEKVPSAKPADFKC